MIPSNYECREGNGIKLFIDPESNYGLSQYVPIKEDHMLYKYYQRLKKLFDEDPEYTYSNPQTVKYNVHFTREETEKILHCLGCNAAKINNWQKYCACCKDFFDYFVNDWYFDKKDGTPYLKYTKRQIEDNLNLNNKDTFLSILKDLNYPYIDEIWKNNIEKCQKHRWDSWTFSMYLSELNNHKKNLEWKDSIFGDINYEI